MKKQILKSSNAFFATILALFGVSSCEPADLYGPPPDNIVAEYGCPYSEYIEVTGTVKNEAEQPIENIQVVSQWDDGYIKDTTYTDQDGNFALRRDGLYPNRDIKLYFNDIDGATNGSYQNDSTDVHITYSEGDGNWNAGVGHGSVTKTLKEKDE